MKNQTILVTGGKGQLGRELEKISGHYPNYNFLFTDKDELDVANHEAVRDYFKRNKIDCVINCAGYTQVDKAEHNKEEAEILNAGVPKLLSKLCNQAKAILVHISTDYVFDGKSEKPYRESDTPNPINHYGITKLQGDQFIKEIADRAIIFRTSWLYSSHGHNFVKTILQKAQAGERLKVVNDQVGTPTYAEDLARTIIQVIEKLPKERFNLLYNFSNLGEASWFDFAKEILKIKEIESDVASAKTSDFSFAAQRPAYSVLDKTLIMKDFGIEIPQWKESLKRCLGFL